MRALRASSIALRFTAGRMKLHLPIVWDPASTSATSWIRLSSLARTCKALLKAACGGDVEDEDKVISAMLELADQFEGASQ